MQRPFIGKLANFFAYVGGTACGLLIGQTVHLTRFGRISFAAVFAMAIFAAGEMRRRAL